MPRTMRPPAYRLYKRTGQAVVTLGGKDHYLGPHGTKASKAASDRLVAEWLLSGRQLAKPDPEPLTVSELLARYLRHCKQHYGQRRTAAQMLSRVKCTLGPVRRLYGLAPAADFGPRALVVVRKQYVDDGLARKTVNDNVQIVKRMFRWAVREEIVPPSTHHALSTVEGLRAGESKAADPRKVKPVPDEHVAAVLPHVLPPVRAMIELQSLSGMRSGEATIMRTGDLDMTGRLWMYKPRYHKGDRHGIEREIPLGPKAQKLVRPFLLTNLDEYMFRPDEAMAARTADRRRQRKTPLYPSHIRRQERMRKRSPRRTPTGHYTPTTFAQAITRACEKARVPEWTPHRLRHAFATRIRKEHGIEVARVMLGHQHVGVTEIYTERDRKVAATVAAKRSG